jgi:hypothetical protein
VSGSPVSHGPGNTGDRPIAAPSTDTSSVFIFDSFESLPTYHDYGRIDRKKDADVTRCGLVMWDLIKGAQYACTLRRDHADKFAKPCRRCFRDAD